MMFSLFSFQFNEAAIKKGDIIHPLNLSNEQELSTFRKYLFACVTLSLAVILVYSNSLTVGWHYDDHVNILENPNIRLSELSWENIQKTFYWDGRFLRPVAYASFALNYYVGAYNVFGYHLVNLLIHLITSISLFFFIYKTLHLNTIRETYRDQAYSISLLAAFLWAIHPIQVHAVTTIVQRMASLCGMFYLLTMLFYLKGRLSENKVIRLTMFCAATCTGILALGTKENAIMIPISLFFYDLILIQGLAKIKNLRQIIIFCVIVLALLITVSIFFIDFSSIPNSYGHRPFTLKERLLTEPRIIVFYISLLLYPLSSRMTLLHDPAISHTLFHPWTTLPAILVIIGAVILALRFSFKKPLWSFCIIFFFLNHIVEGSFIALELIYEHRNYIPSMFFFIPVSIAMLQVVNYFSYNNSLKYTFVFSFSCLLAMLGHTVYERNQIMQTEIGLWLDNVKKSPNLSRVQNNIGEYFWNKGFLEKSCVFFSTAHHLNHEMNSAQYGVICCNLGNCYFTVAKQFDKAQLLYEKALKLYRGYPQAYGGLALIYLKKGDPLQAKRLFTTALKSEPENPAFLHGLALTYFMEKEYDQCISLAKRALLHKEDDEPALILLGQSYFIKGNLEQSTKYWQALNRIHPKRIMPFLALLEIYIIGKDADKVTMYLDRLKKIAAGRSIEELMVAAGNENPNFPVYMPNRNLLNSFLQKTL
jgi:tetratricopeptide (TPR) repeat protein